MANLNSVVKRLDGIVHLKVHWITGRISHKWKQCISSTQINAKLRRFGEPLERMNLMTHCITCPPRGKIAPELVCVAYNHAGND